MINTMHIKKIFYILLSLLLYFVIGGCGGSGGSSYSGSATLGTASLSWNVVTTYTDNSVFTAAGYKVYYGTAHNTYTSVIDIPVAALVSKSTPTYTIKNLRPGTYYFAVSVYDSSKRESVLSTEVIKVIY